MAVHYYMKKRRAKKYLKNNMNRLKKLDLKIKEVQDGIILPAEIDTSSTPKLWARGGVLDKNGHFVEESSSSYFFGGNYEINLKRVKKIKEEVIFLGPFVKHWGHFICDQISRLWYVIDNPEKYKIAYCGWNWHNAGITDIDDNFLQFFELLGIKKIN